MSGRNNSNKSGSRQSSGSRRNSGSKNTGSGRAQRSNSNTSATSTTRSNSNTSTRGGDAAQSSTYFGGGSRRCGAKARVAKRGFFAKLFDGLFPSRTRRRSVAGVTAVVADEAPAERSTSRRSSSLGSMTLSEIEDRDAQMEDAANQGAVIDALPLADLAAFWTTQISQHNLFLKLGLAPTELKLRAYELHLKWADLLESRFHDPLRRAGLGDSIHKIFLDTADLDAIGELSERDLERMEKLLDEQRDFELELLELLGSGQWIGAIYPSFVAHIARETKLTKAIVSGIPMTVNELTNAFIHDAAEDAGLTAHLLDPRPVNMPDIEKAHDFQRIFMSLYPERELDDIERTYIGLSVASGEQLDMHSALDSMKRFAQFGLETKEKIDRGKQEKRTVLFSTIHPLLITHNLREHLRAIETLERIKRARAAQQQE